MTLGRRIAEQHRRAYHGEAWHGPSIFELLEGVSAGRAAERPLAKAHTIWELVLHLTSWERIVRSRLVGAPMAVNDTIDWPKPAPKPTKKEWNEALANLREASDATTAFLARMPESKLLSKRPGTDSTFEELAHGQVQHALYHAGQIAVLMKGARKTSR